MKKLLSGAAVALALSAAPAYAASFVATPGQAVYPPSSVYAWDGSRDSGFSTAVPPSVPNVYANPLGNTTKFGYVYPNQVGTFDLTGLTSLTFIWGSADPSNLLKLFDINGNLVDSWLGSADLLGDTSGSHTAVNANPFITLTFSPQEAGYLEFSTGQIAFEVATFNLGAVPEPSTWAMMIMGIGLVGFGMRRRQKVQGKISFA